MTAVLPPPGRPTAPPGPAAWANRTAARLPSQVGAYAVVAIAVLIATIPYGQATWGVIVDLALAAGVAIGIVTTIGERFRAVTGAVAALAAGALWLIVATLLGAYANGPDMFLLAFPIAAFTFGLDWRQVERLRTLPFASGFAVLFGIAEGRPWVFLAGLVWIGVSFATLASLEADRRETVTKAAPLVPNAPHAPVSGVDLATTLITAVAIAAIAALVLSVPSCRTSLSGGDRTGSERIPGGSGGDGSGYGDGQGGSGGSGGGSGGYGGGSGDGGTLEGGGSGHTYVRDPNGDFLIPGGAGSGDPNGDGFNIPIPAEGVGPEGQDRTGPDGSSRTWSRNGEGNLQVEVRERDGTTRRFRYEPQDDGTTRITESDRRGRDIRTWTYDPDGRFAEDSSGQGGSQSPSSDADRRDHSKTEFPDLRIVGLVLLGIAAIVALAWWINRRVHRPPDPPAPPWAVALARRIEREGRRRGRTRKKHETVVAYTDALAADELPDDRLVEVGTIVSTAMFGPEGPTDELRVHAEQTFDSVVADHPRPSARERRAHARDKVTTAG